MDAPAELPAVDVPLLSGLLAPGIEPLFWRPLRQGYDSAWTAHVPFAHWVVAATRPHVLVELGTHNGVSYSAFCEAVINARLETRCYAVDTWQGDEHAGAYSNDVYDDLKRFHDQHYASFSELLRCTFDEALRYMPDGSIDLLHIDGLHTYDAVRHDFDAWLPKLSGRAVVILHDTNVRERDFGVWRLFEELRGSYPAFEFLHEYGLGVVAVGHDAPAAIAGLCALTDPTAIAAVRERFSQLGERWRFEVHMRLLIGEVTARDGKIAALSHERNLQEAAAQAARAATAELQRVAAENDRLRARTAQRSEELRRAAAAAYQELARLRDAHDKLSTEHRRDHAALVVARRAVATSAQLRARVAQRSEEARRAAATAYHELEGLMAEVQIMRAASKDLARQLHAMVVERRALTWRLTAPLRRAAERVPKPLREKLARGTRRALRVARLQRSQPEPPHMRQHLRMLASTDLFDPDWYIARYPDAAASSMDPALHFVLAGGPEGRDPGPRFDSRAYLTANPDVAAVGAIALMHYVESGANEGRNIKPVVEERFAAPAQTAAPEPAAPTPATVAPGLRMVIIAGEPGTPGETYRVTRFTHAAELAGAQVVAMAVGDVLLLQQDIRQAQIVVIWRAAWGLEVEVAVGIARQTGAKLMFDLDDLMIEPDLAQVKVIDGIRSQNIPAEKVQEHFGRIRTTMGTCDFCVTTTEELAWYLRRHGKPTVVLPNGFERGTLRQSRRIARRRAKAGGDGLVRLGYATGSRTHQRDFAQIAGPVARILREHPQTRLVLFADPADELPMLSTQEFPDLAGLEAQIEWRDLVDLTLLPEELGRFDINLAPLETGNPFCEAKSELKYFEGALVNVCTVASPTGPFRRAISHGTTGFLAETPDEWYETLRLLVDDPALRLRVARTAYRDVLWRFGPECRAEAVASILAQVRGGQDAARAFVLDVQRTTEPAALPQVPEGEIVFSADALGDADVTVIVPLYNYANFVVEALDSVRAQTLATLDLVITDDCSTDASLDVAQEWARAHASRFNRIVVQRNRTNAGLGMTRNAGFAAAETPYVLPLDADNRLLPACCETLLRHAEASRAAFVYPVIRRFGDVSDLMGIFPYAPARLIGVPFIDAMALVSVAAWSCAGGYSDTRLGWEDYEFWCRMAERGLNGLDVPGEPLAEYRVHRGSMLNAITEAREIKPKVIEDMNRRHPWLRLVAAKAPASVPTTSGVSEAGSEGKVAWPSKNVSTDG